MRPLSALTDMKGKNWTVVRSLTRPLILKFSYLPFPDKRAFFLVSTSSIGPQIYELGTSTITERNT